jgi:hypothetical protein
MEKRIMTLGHVTGAHLKYAKGTFGGGFIYTGQITSDATDQATLNSILDGTYRIIWMTPGVGSGVVNPVVSNPTTGQGAGSRDLGYVNGAPAAPELEARYGPHP